MRVEHLLWVSLVGGLVALGFAVWRVLWVARQPVTSVEVRRISQLVADGAKTFLSRETKWMIPFVLLVAVLLAISNRGHMRLQAVAFLLGALCSLVAGHVGMRIATASNSRTADAASRTGLPGALRVAFSGGSAIGMSIVGLSLLGLSSVGLVLLRVLGSGVPTLRESVLPIVTGFSLGASSIALFARVGGGIYTKAADVGADLVGKVEAGIPEDDPRNPATTKGR